MNTQHAHRARAPRDTRSGTVVAALVERGLLSPSRRDEAVAVVDEALGEQRLGHAPLGRRFAELAGYIGAAFVVSAAGVLLATQWTTLSDTQQIALVASIAVVLTAAGAAVLGVGVSVAAVRAGAEPVRRRLAGVLFVGAAAAAGGAVGLQVARMTDDPFSSVPTLWGFGVVTVAALVGYLVVHTVVGQLAVAVAATVTLTTSLDLAGGVQPVAFGATMLILGVVWLLLAERGVWRETASARVIGCMLVVMGAQAPVFDTELRWVGYLTLALVAVAAFGLYVVRAAWPYLATGVVAVTLVVPEALIDWAGDAIGPAGGLLVAGITLLVASLLGFRLRKEVTEAAA